MHLGPHDDQFFSFFFFFLGGGGGGGGIKQGHALQPTRGFGIDSSITLYQVAIGSSVMWPAFQPNLLIEVTCNFQVGCVAMVGTAWNNRTH